ncbi:hypothetical protein BIY27_01390 [Gibbsiella quercinecans]|nr:hypothetical protein BIY27_01390 [Gibbsiella quercinecans]
MNHRLSCSKNRRSALCLAALFTCLYAGKSYSRPDMTPLGPNIADRGSSFYHFSVSRFDSADGKRHYNVWTGVPNSPPPATGFPVLYMLDGNAVMDRLSDALLKQLAAQSPPVLVVIGYQTALPFDLHARAYDYTPPVKDNNVDDRQNVRGRMAGGGLIFRHLLETTLAPQAEKGLNIDQRKRGIWGHSLGGVFVLEAYLSSAFFSRYYAASPSLNRDYVGLLQQLAAIDKRKFCGKQLYLSEGNGAPGKNPEAPPPDVLNKVRATASSLHQAGLPVTYRPYPELSHGQMFNVGFEQALLDMAKNAAGKQCQ